MTQGDTSQVLTFSLGDEETLDADPVGDTDLLRGLIKDGDEFTLWLDPHEFTA